MPDPLIIARSGDVELALLPALANRHGLITGATGTGKTVTLQRVAEGLSRIGVPVFMADVKGDLAGLSQAGEPKGKIKERFDQLKLKKMAFEACPVVLWDAFGTQGHPVRATVSEMGPLLLARMLNLNDTQAGVLGLTFKIADDKGQVARIMKTQTDEAKRIEEIFLCTLCRPPSDAERQACLSYVRESATPAEGYRGVMWSLLNTREFLLQH